MLKIGNMIAKFFVMNVLVLVSIMLLPVFLVTSDVPIYEQIMDYLFHHSS